MYRLILCTLVHFSSIMMLFADVKVEMQAPAGVSVFETAEFVFTVSGQSFENPFADVEIEGVFTRDDSSDRVSGFCDSDDGSVFRLRYSPGMEGAVYTYQITVKGDNLNRVFSGSLSCDPGEGKGPVITNPASPRHLVFKGTGEPFYHLGYTAYNLLDISNSDEQIEETINYCHQHGFNKIRFLLTGYPRDFDNRTSDDVDHGVPEDPWKSPNYGAFSGRVNPLPAWKGKAHDYDFERFNVSHWQRAERAVRLMREKGIIATCILIIEKQNLPRELGTLTRNEYRLYKYAVARLAAFDNVWWDLGNEHNEFRSEAWGNTMGDFVKEQDPYDRLASAHAYAEFFYNDSPWADFIITQQYGDMDSVHNWALSYRNVPKPYVNEEYGYEGRTDSPSGHGMNGEWVRRCHWAIAMAGGYATYGDWSNGVSYFYMGIPGPGSAATELKHLRNFFEILPFARLSPSDELTTNGYCLSLKPDIFIFYLPQGGTADIDLSSARGRLLGRWFNTASGEWGEKTKLKKGKNTITSTEGKDAVLLVTTNKVKLPGRQVF
ncbi:MAG: DUF4038 domain-containing protein [Bacteroidales bacterium]|nr:DUF4038 domain-containing protein [Bacteroidales bacterium]